MSSRELNIRLTADSNGVRDTFNRLLKQTEDLKGIIAKPAYLDVELREGIVQARIKKIQEDAQKFAERKKILLEAEVIEKEAQQRAAPQNIPLRPIIDRTKFEQDVRDEKARLLKSIRSDTRANEIRVAARLDVFGEEDVRGAEAGLARVAEAAKHTEGGLKGVFERLKQSFGRGSTFQDFVEVAFSAGGPIIGIGLAAREFEHLGEAASEAGRKLATGEISFAGAAKQFVEGVPILGSLIKGTEGLGEGINGLGAAILRAQGAEEAQIRRWAGQAEAARFAAEEVQKYRDTLDSLAEAAKHVGEIRFASANQTQLGALTGADRDREAARQEIEARQKAQQDDLEAQRKKVIEDAKKTGATPSDIRAGTVFTGPNAEQIVGQLRDIDAAIAESKANAANEMRRRLSEINDKELSDDVAAEQARLDAIDRFKERRREATEAGAALEAEAREKSLRASGQALEAELAGIRRNYDQRIAEIERLAEAEAKANPNKAFEIFGEAGRSTGALRESQAADEQAARKKAADDVATHQQQIDKILSDGRRAALQAEVETGNLAAERELKRLEIQERYRDIENEIRRAIEDEQTTDEQRARLRERMASLSEEERRAEEIATREQNKPGQSADLVERGALSGIGTALKVQFQIAANNRPNIPPPPAQTPPVTPTLPEKPPFAPAADGRLPLQTSQDIPRAAAAPELQPRRLPPQTDRFVDDRPPPVVIKPELPPINIGVRVPPPEQVETPRFVGDQPPPQTTTDDIAAAIKSGFAEFARAPMPQGIGFGFDQPLKPEAPPKSVDNKQDKGGETLSSIDKRIGEMSKLIEISSKSQDKLVKLIEDLNSAVKKIADGEITLVDA